MKRILLALLLIAFLLSGCGAKDNYSSLPTGTNQPSGNASNSLQTEGPNQAEEQEQTAKPDQPEQPEEPKQAEKADVSGIYTDKQGTPNVYNDLTLTLQADGTYAAEIGIYRVAGLKGTAAWDGDVLRFISEDPHVLADISIDDGKAEVVIIAGAAGILTGDVYSFPDGAPDESEEGYAAFQPSLSDEIAVEIFYTEEQEKVVEKKQQEADTQPEMNETAKEMYQLWDDTLNAVWKLLEANLSESDMEVLRKEKNEWIVSKEAEVQAAGQENEGGSLQPLLEAATAAELTKARVYELAKYAEGK